MSYEEYRRMGADPEIAEIFVEAEARMRRRDKEQSEAHTESQSDEIGAAVILSVHADFRAWDDEDDADDPEDEDDPDYVWGLDCPPYIHDPHADDADWEQLTLDLRFDREEDDDDE